MNDERWTWNSQCRLWPADFAGVGHTSPSPNSVKEQFIEQRHQPLEYTGGNPS